MSGIQYQFADTPELLQKLLGELPPGIEVSLDTEADSMHHYGVKLCLIQLGFVGRHWLVDPLAGFDLQPLWDALRGRHLLFHGADYDLRMLSQHANFLPASMFDTMIASKFGGEERQGLAALVEKYFGAQLEKSNQKADWTRRPLPPEMLHYAALDTYYLPELRDILTRNLEASGKLGWVQETCAQLIRSVSDAPPEEPETDPWRIKGSTKLQPRELAVLRSIWVFREQEAQALDRPPFKVMDAELMLHLARICSAGLELPKLPRNFVGERLDRLLEAIDAGLDIPKEQCPPREKPLRWSGPQPDSAVVEKIRVVRDRLASEHCIDPTLLANRNQITQMALPDKHKPNSTPRQRAALLDWQWNLMGPELSFLK